jgi:hypothetical protein
MFLETETFPGRHSGTKECLPENASGDRNVSQEMCWTSGMLPGRHPCGLTQNSNISRYEPVASNCKKAHLNETITVAHMPLVFCIIEIAIY